MNIILYCFMFCYLVLGVYLCIKKEKNEKDNIT